MRRGGWRILDSASFDHDSCNLDDNKSCHITESNTGLLCLIALTCQIHAAIKQQRRPSEDINSSSAQGKKYLHDQCSISDRTKLTGTGRCMLLYRVLDGLSEDVIGPRLLSLSRLAGALGSPQQVRRQAGVDGVPHRCTRRRPGQGTPSCTGKLLGETIA